MHPGIYALSNPKKPAYIMASTGEVMTYEQLEKQSNRTAHLFRRYGLKPKDGIVVLLENHPLYFVICWASQRSGLYFTPISTQFHAPEVQYIVEDCEAKLLVTSQRYWPVIQQIKNELTHVEKILILADEKNSDDECVFKECNNNDKNNETVTAFWLNEVACLPETPIEDECEGAEMFYSSGTTGQSKGVKLPHYHWPLGRTTDLYKKRVTLHCINAQTRYLSTAPLYHSAPVRYNMMVMREGGTCIIMEKFDAESSLKLIEQYRITHSQWVPTMFVRLLKLPDEVRLGYDVSSLQIAIHAAAPCAIPIKQRMIDWWGPIVCEYYSGTEANGATAINSQEWLSHKGSVGRPIAGGVHIVDENGDELAVGEQGIVYFSGGVDFQYHNDPQKTAAAKNNKGWSTLGDIGYLDGEGYLYLTDRKAFTIISGGVNIYPQEVENLLITHDKVFDVAVFGVPNEEFGEEVKAVVQPVNMSDAGAELEGILLDYCRSHLAHLKCPRSIDFEASLPRHPTGKLYKKALKDRYWLSD